MVQVSNADRVVFPEVGRTKGDVVAYYERMAARALPHLHGRPLSIRRFPKGLAAPGFFQKNVPPHYPKDIERVEVARTQAASKLHKDARNAASDVTTYPLVASAEQLAYLANQGAIELHVPTARVPTLARPDRLIFDLDPPKDSFAKVREAARLTRAALEEYGLASVPVATGSKGYHVVAAIAPSVDNEELALAAHKFATLLQHRHTRELTTTWRVAQRGGRVFVDWLRNNPASTGVAPFSLRASARATVAVPIAWDELDAIAPDTFTLDDAAQLLDRPDSLATLAEAPGDARAFVNAVDAAFASAGLVLEPFDRFRS